MNAAGAGAPDETRLGAADNGRELRLSPGATLRLELPEVATSGLR